MKHNHDAITYLDKLITLYPEHMNTLLDMRLSMMNFSEPGSCVAGYFQLKKSLSAWHDTQLQPLKELLESHIQIEIVIQETQERRNACLAIGNNSDLENYCEEKMSQIASKHNNSKNIRMGFSWA